MKDTCMLSMPALSEDMTVLAVCNLNFCKLMIFSSMVALVIIRQTFTTFFCPILWALSIACRSFIGFQSCSTKITWEGTVTIIQQHQKLREATRGKIRFQDFVIRDLENTYLFGTVSAPVRLRPNPPTLVERRSRSMLGSELNLETIVCLFELVTGQWE